MGREERREERRRRFEEKIQRYKEHPGIYVYRGGHGHIWTGVFLLLIGVFALMRASGIDFPQWLFSWQMFLIALGVFTGLKHGFRGSAWFIMIVIGGVFLLRDFYPELEVRRYIWPVALILLGFYLIARPRRRPWKDEKKNGDANLPGENPDLSKDDFVTSTSIFGGMKKNILSKDFKGADIVNIFGGTELNLTQADITGKVPIEMTTIFGGTKLIIPPNWSVQSEAVTLFGGLEDKRPASPESTDKILLLRGTVIFGGIEIKSY
jgi:predicted membrane protein